MEQHRLKRLLSHLLIAGEYHADNPEENNVIPCHQHIRGIEVFQILRLFRPPKRGERPQSRGKPGVQCIGILGEMGFTALRTHAGRFLRHHNLPALVAVVSRNPVPPPELAADAPVADVIRPVVINLVHAFRDEPDLAFLHRLHRRFDQFVHLYEPLFLDHRLDGRLTAVMGAYVVGIVLDPHEKPLFLQFLHDPLSRLVPVKSLISAAVCIDGGIIVHNVDFRQVVAFAHLEIVGVMGGRNLHNACPELHVHILVFHYGNGLVYDRQPDLSSL